MDKEFENNKNIAELILMNGPVNSTLFIVEYMHIKYFSKTHIQI